MEDFFTSKGISLQTDTNNDTIIETLNAITKEITPNIFFNETTHHKIKIFAQILKYFVCIFEKGTPSIKVMVSNTLGKFLVRFFPHFSLSILKGAFDVANLFTQENKTSLVLASVFCYCIKFTSPKSHKDIIKFFPSLPHFTDINTPNFSNVPHLLERIGRFNKNWAGTILGPFLTKDPDSKNRALFNSILALVKNYPELFDEAVEIILSNNNPNLDLISFLFSQTNYIMISTIEPQLAKYAYELLTKEGSTMVQKDSAFQILKRIDSVESLYLDGNLQFKYNDISIMIPFNEVKTISSLYKFPIKEILPVTKDDSALVATVKWETSGDLGLIENFSKGIGDKPELLSPFLSGLRHLIRKLDDSNELAELIHKYIFVKPQSWFHSVDILGVMSELNVERSKKLFGIEQTIKMCQIAFECTLSENAKLSSSAITFFHKFNPTHEIFSLNMLTDFYEKRGFLNTVTIVKSIAKDEDYLAVMNCLTEAVEYFIDDMEVLLAYYDCSADFKYPLNPDSPSVVKAIRYCEDFVDSLNTTNFDEFFANKNGLDVVDGALDIDNFFRPLERTLKFLSNVSKPVFRIIGLIDRAAPFCPSACTSVCASIFEKVEAPTRERLAAEFMGLWKTARDITYVSDWCEILYGWMQHKESIKSAAIEYFTNAVEENHSVDEKFIVYLVRMCGMFKKDLDFIPEKTLEACLDSFEEKCPDVYTFLTGNKPKIKLNQKQKFVFVNPTPDELRKSEESAVFSMVAESVSDEYLQEMLKTYVASKSMNGLISLINYAKRRNRIILFKDVEIPLLMINSVLNYAMQVKSKELPILANRFKHLNGLIGETCFMINPEDFVNDFFQTPKPPSKKIMEFLTFVQRSYSYFNQEVLKTAVVHILDTCKNMKRMKIGLHLVRAIMGAMSNLPLEFLLTITALMIQNKEFLDGYETARICYMISQKMTVNKKVCEIYDSVIDKIKPSFPAHILIRLSMLSEQTSSKSFSQLIDLCENNIQASNVNFPSLTIMSLRLMIQLLKVKETNHTHNLIEKQMPFLISLIQKNWKNPSFCDILGEIVSFVMSRNSLSNVSDLIVKSITQIVPPSSYASYQIYAQILPKAVRRRFLLPPTKPPNVAPPFSIFKVDMGCLCEQIELNYKDYDSKYAFIMDRVTTWLQSTKDTDCYSMSFVVFEWQSLIQKYLTSQDVVSTVCFQFHKFIPRFFPLFVAMAIFMRKEAKSGKDISGTLEMIESVVITRPHKEAVKLINVPGKMGIALKLASFSSDCEEADNLISKLTK
ncbi:hypothetical protein TVAG_484610 [Trichomonas vaginalis G3]|uniref:Uncharacterized protein n=1 Tax=Trichomonas vaginalis (strain ATCC PRA-98 / G3) TaxID=412133 RepID=A2F1Y9_TRIV3|nr:hypothetical protein TVAGG3_0128170 [Trichomonas vaginalis G3]EAY01087.1 hypothetical protein TVAG_484610 [Trichomonas vaginalis G3]KAI5545912.1 hypothetical protein TVAGG3_0128170 [Trichomonas vaginalis G3]|eukprot:XP_001330103.1 hypothetical protein [Trichomonas vaginalis G3]